MNNTTTFEYKENNYEENSYASNYNKPRDYQLYAKDVLGWEIIDLLQDEDTYGHRLLSRADLILIFALYNKNGLEGFYQDYMAYAQEKYDTFGELGFVQKPHIYLKNLIG